MELSGMQIFKYLPAAKKAPNSNCKKCGCPTCMAFALKLAKGSVEIDACENIPDELKEIFEKSRKAAQKTIEIQGVKIGGENVLFRHEKTFLNPTALCVLLDCQASDFEEKLKRVKNFEINILNNSRKVDLIILKNSGGKTFPNTISFEEFEKLPIKIILDDEFSHSTGLRHSGQNAADEERATDMVCDPESHNYKSDSMIFVKTAQELKFIREKAIKEKDENFSNPVCVHFAPEGGSNSDETEYLNELCARASFYICKYANALLFEDFDEALFTTLITLRENIFTDPQKPLKVEPKIYEFNEVDENSLIFMTTNFALTFFAVANELENLKHPSYLIVTPADGMSVLTAWSAEKFTAKMVVQTLIKYDLASKVKNRKIIIPGLLAHMQKEIQSEINAANLDFEIIIGTIDACEIADFVKDFEV